MIANIFRNNVAQWGGGGIYFNNRVFKEMPNSTNLFINNIANFANDFYTFPLRSHLNNTFNWINVDNMYALVDIVPGTPIPSLQFEIVDYYGQTIQSLNGRYFSFYKIIFNIFVKLFCFTITNHQFFIYK